MKIETEKLITFNNYANKVGKSRVWIDKLALRGDIKSTKIDGVKFVILEEGWYESVVVYHTNK